MIETLYEDEDIVVINKPAGLVVHSDGRTQEDTVSDWFVQKYPQARNVGEKMGEIERPGIVHRIDRETSGALLLAKTALGHKVLKEQFQNREIDKSYNAFVYGSVEKDHGTINFNIERSKSDFRKWIAVKGALPTASLQGRDAVTYFQVLKRAADKSATLVEAKPKTGRTHQIRVHFRALHHPVVGDKLYAPGKEPVLGFRRLALHARSLKFRNTKGEEIAVEAPYPADFQHAVDTI